MTATNRKAQMAAAMGSRSQPATAHTAVRTKDARITLNLPPELYRQLGRWCDSAAVAIDAPRVSVQDALRAMLRVGINDTAAAGAVLQLLREERDS